MKEDQAIKLKLNELLQAEQFSGLFPEIVWQIMGGLFELLTIFSIRCALNPDWIYIIRY